MNYRVNKKNGDEFSILGFGCMRFPKTEEETEKLILHAIENGVNYFDTAYIYPNSEVTLGRILNKHNKRKDIKLATKLPPYLVKKTSDFDKIFNQQLERLQTDYIDYYFIHALSDVSVLNRLFGLGLKEWLEEKVAEGKIINIGFSFHGGKEDFVEICDAYDWEFCMIQYNYLDENNQACRSGLQYASNKGLPVIIMEPLRGGTLANSLVKGAVKAFDEAHVKRTPAEWSFRWIWNQSEVTCVISGMNSIEMLNENIKVASTANIGDFTEEDLEVVAKAKKAFDDVIKVACTGCNYCMPCPQGVDIPTCFVSYNNIGIEGQRRAVSNYVLYTAMTANPKYASLCNKCGKCEKLCPQKIEIRKELDNTKKALEKFYFKPMMFVMKRIMNF